MSQGGGRVLKGGIAFTRSLFRWLLQIRSVSNKQTSTGIHFERQAFAVYAIANLPSHQNINNAEKRMLLDLAPGAIGYSPQLATIPGSLSSLCLTWRSNPLLSWGRCGWGASSTI